LTSRIDWIDRLGDEERSALEKVGNSYL